MRTMRTKQIAVQIFNRYYTDSSVEVTKRIKDGRTELFTGADTKALADARAKEMRSYSYPVFVFVKGKGLVSAGHAVPK